MSLTSKMNIKSLNQSSSLSSTGRSKQKTLSSKTKSLLNSTNMENIEIEYIKNLQQQVYFLEMECNYLRQQLNLNGLQTTLKYDQKSQELKNEMRIIQTEKNKLEQSLHEENEHKENVLKILEQTEKTFHKERELLLKEISALKNQKLCLEENLLNKSVELTKLKDNLTNTHLDSHDSIQHLSKIEIQLENVRKDNLKLRAELNESRSQLISRDNLIKDLQHQLADPNLRKSSVSELKSSLSNISMKLSMTNEQLSKEATTAKQLNEKNSQLQYELETYKNKINELTKENTRISSSLEISLKQNEADLIMAKKNAELTKANVEKLQNDLENERSINNSLKTQIEQFKLQERFENKNQTLLKKTILELETALESSNSTQESSLKNLQDQLRNKQRELDAEKNKWSHDYNNLLIINKNLETKLNEINDSIDRDQLSLKVNLETTKSRANELQSRIDDLNLSLLNEKNNSKSLQLKIDSLERQESVQVNLISSLKVRINELESQIEEFNNIREPDWINQLKESNIKISLLEEENRNLKSELDNLNMKIKEIDRLKQLEDLVQSQKWGELGQLAESMKTLSKVMSSTTGSTLRHSFENDYIS